MEILKQIWVVQDGNKCSADRTLGWSIHRARRVGYACLGCKMNTPVLYCRRVNILYKMLHAKQTWNEMQEQALNCRDKEFVGNTLYLWIYIVT